MQGNNQVALGQATVNTANEFVKLTFKKDGEDYRLKSGDVLVVSGTATDNGKTFTTNPYKLTIK